MSIISIDLRSWNLSQATVYDTAVKGASPDQLIYQRAVMSSVARWEKLHTLHLLWDITGFYEHVRADAIQLAMEKESLPAGTTALSLWGHSGVPIVCFRLVKPSSFIMLKW